MVEEFSAPSDMLDVVSVTPTALSVIPAYVHRSLSDELYVKRKNGALELEYIARNLTSAGDHEKISMIIDALIREFAKSPEANYRKGGLIGLAAVTIGLSLESARQYLPGVLQLLCFDCMPLVINAFSDEDSRVRYYACEALYNIVKAVRRDFVVFFDDTFDALCKLSVDSDTNVRDAARLLDRLVKDIVLESDQFRVEEFILLFKERMNSLNPCVREFLVGWYIVLDSAPDIDMRLLLPDFIDDTDYPRLDDQASRL